jgi:SAM-dependent methyltransferase
MSEIYETIKCCRICGSDNIEEVLDLGDQPPANSLYRDGEKRPPNVPLKLMYCQKCSTVQLSEDVDPEYLFNEYLWVTGTSKTAEKYSYEFAKKALSQVVGHNKSPYIVEIASNDGTFLKRFIEKGCKVLGVDPAKNIAKLAVKNGIPTIADFFTLDLAERLMEKEGAADIVFARNVIPHVKEIHSVIEGMSAIIDEDGVGIIEVHNAGLILEELHYDYIYHEHLFYYTLKTISGLIERHGLHVFDVMLSPISGGSWVVYFSKKKKEKTKELIKHEKQELESNINSYHRWVEFSDQVAVHSEKLKKIALQGGKKIPAYGASARSSTLLNFCGISNKHISVVIDKNPMKNGLMTVGSNIPVVSFEDGLKEIKSSEKILLLAWNFQDEIVQELREAGFTGEFIIPLPGDPHML